jgi:hypothetical protein
LLLAALCGLLGTAALSVYFSAALVPLPPDDASTGQIVAFAVRYRDAILFDAWLQAIGTLLTVVFAVALVQLAGAAHRLAGRLTLLVAGVLMTLSLAEGTFAFAVIQGATSGHPATAVAGFDLTNVFVHVFLIAPSLFLMLGLALRGTHLLPRTFTVTALALGIVFELIGFAGLFNTTAVALVIVVQIVQELWIIAAAIALIARAARGNGGPAHPVDHAIPR